MPASATARRTWPAAPIGARDSLDAVARELAGHDQARRGLAFCVLEERAAVLLRDLERQATSPRRREGRRQLRRLSDAFCAAADAAEDLHPSFLDVTEKPEAFRAALRDQVAALRAMAALAAGVLRGLDERELARPGPGCIADLVCGEPRLQLARASARIVIAFRGRALCTSTPGGLVYRVAAGIWAFATGEDPEGFGLERYVVSAVAAERGQAELPHIRQQPARTC